jgi:hypothetical protein
MVRGAVTALTVGDDRRERSSDVNTQLAHLTASTARCCRAIAIRSRYFWLAEVEGPDRRPEQINAELTAARADAWPVHARAGRLRYWLASIVVGGCSGPSGSTLPWSSRNGGYRSVINAT